MMSNPDFVKAAVMEGCGVHDKGQTSPQQVINGLEHDTNALHLVGGGSLQAFSAYFTKHIIEKPEHLPVRVVAAGRNYSPVTLRHPGLLGCRQSSVIDGLILYEDVDVQEKTLLHEVMVTMIEIYRHLGIHFQVVQYSAEHLYTHERAAIGVTMYSPHTGQYHEVGRISLCGDYISRRLWTLCRKDKKSASFVSMLHVRACHTARLLGLLMENCQEEDSTYSLPGCLQSAVDAF
ncbi:Serine--tRNA ligase, mitochondrial [Chionoecetes opilio]|uniref:Serine--tRNA ligase, mitochondrial n=1 Tax=Chionoecetes opilio TaxID=41210 RepID=A0A8J4XM28_CHIOP|nr:Serine--tRNA ligase, mitochondrial [Chionoecetes opilio]